jgi:glycosyltransferase involved in cell wall biosynthesis
MASEQERPAIAFFSDYVPRRCGIATFTYDLCEAVAAASQDQSDVFAVAVSDIPEGYPYPDRVRFEVRQSVPADYRLAADFLNIRRVAAVCVQHEYGIYGGTCGAHLLAALKRLRRPVVTTLHTVLKTPSVEQRQVLNEIARLTDRLVVMSRMGIGMLGEVFGIPKDKIVYIPHGIPDIPFVDPNFYKDQFGLAGRKALLTFGLLSPGKGIEYVIRAMPAIVKKHPDVVYIVLGATHPQVRRESGEEYRSRLIRIAEDLGVAENVMFVNRFVSVQELCEFLGAADIYITPYLNEGLITSGTLSYALGAGKATISTPYWYAQEMLAEGRGRLVPFRNSELVAEQVKDLFENETEYHAMRKRAYNFCRKMIWKQVAQDYIGLFDVAGQAWAERLPRIMAASREHKRVREPEELPEVDLRHLRTLTDHTGILQHCVYSTPDRRHGYCTDDNARALIVAVMHWNQTQDERTLPLMQTYLAFLNHAFDEKTGRFRNFMRYDRAWHDDPGSEDSHARALWGLGVAAALCPYEPMIGLATRLFTSGLAVTQTFTSPRAWAFAIIGIHEYLRRFGGDSEARRQRASLTDKLVRIFRDNMSDQWPWCENIVTYASAKLPHALLMSGKWLGRNDVIDLGKRSLAWLLDIETNKEGNLSIIGTEGWYVRGGNKARFDQQPVSAHALLHACIEAYHVTREDSWIGRARKVFNWFLGDNDLRIPLHDFTTGGCCDGLQQDRVNVNQGAESTLAWLMSLLLMYELQMELTLGEVPADKATGDRPAPRAIKPISGAVGAIGAENVEPDSNR